MCVCVCVGKLQRAVSGLRHGYKFRIGLRLRLGSALGSLGWFGVGEFIMPKKFLTKMEIQGEYVHVMCAALLLWIFS